MNQFIEASIAIELTPELVIKFSYSHLGCGKHRRLGKMASSAKVLP